MYWPNLRHGLFMVASATPAVPGERLPTRCRVQTMMPTPTMTHTHTGTAQGAPAPNRLLRIGEVTHQTGVSRSQIYRLIAAGKFPRSVQLIGRGTVWPESEVQAWIACRIAAAKAA